MNEQPHITVGEMIPWKGGWWKVTELDTITGAMKLQPVKLTSAFVKRVTKWQRWIKAHPDATLDHPVRGYK